MSAAARSGDRPLRIYALFGDGGQQAGRVARGERHELHFSAFGFDELVERGTDPIGVRTPVLEQVLAEMEGFDAVFSDSPEVVLLRYVRQRRGLRPLPWLVNEVDGFAGARLVRRFVEHHYGEDPLPETLGAPEVQWFSICPDLQQRYGRLGLRLGNLHYLPMARASIAFFFPETIALQDRLLEAEGDPARRSCEVPVAPGGVLALGSHERDYACLDEALRPTDLTADIICNLALYPLRPEAVLRWYDSQPPEVYLEAIRRARVVVLPLRPTGRASGQLSAALPMRLGKPIVATGLESVAPLIEHRVTGLTYGAGDAADLRRCLQELWDDPAEAARLGAAAAAREGELSAVAAASLETILRRLRRSAAQTGST